MVSKEKILEKRLDDIRNIFIALTIAIIITIPITIFTFKEIIQYITYLLIYVAIVSVVYIYIVLKREKLYSEWGRDPMKLPPDAIAGLTILAAGIIILILMILIG